MAELLVLPSEAELVIGGPNREGELLSGGRYLLSPDESSGSAISSIGSTAAAVIAAGAATAAAYGGGDGSNYTTGHDAARDMVAAYLRSIYGYLAVHVEYPIAGGGHETGTNGRAGVVLIYGNQIWVWEVKWVSDGAQRQGVKDLNNYINALEDSGQWGEGNVHKGFNIPQLVMNDPLNKKKELVAESANTVYNGLASDPAQSAGTFNGIVAWWTRNNGGQQRNREGYTINAPGAHRQNGKLQSGGADTLERYQAYPQPGYDAQPWFQNWAWDIVGPSIVAGLPSVAAQVGAQIGAQQMQGIIFEFSVFGAIGMAGAGDDDPLVPAVVTQSSLGLAA